MQHHGITPDQLEILTDTVTQMGEYCNNVCAHMYVLAYIYFVYIFILNE